MKSKIKIAALALGAVAIVGGYALFANISNNYNSILQSDPAPLVKTAYTVTANPPGDFEKAANSAVPSVVHIKTITKAREVASRNQQQQNPFGDMFGNDEFFKKFFGDGGRSFQQPEQRASGSGVIISNDGYIVTNNHVVDGATDISVTSNDRKIYKAKVIGTDPNTDLALIKIDAKNQPVMPLGNSDDVHLGQWVLAIGYPLNLDVTVTQGIVSAKSRNIGINQQGSAPVEAFIQTDAAVNPGSSGGALVNTNGDLVGINAAIASPTGTYAGYAYSIPSNLMKKVIGDIMKFGTVQRGYLGIRMAPENLDDAKKKELCITDEVPAVWVMETDPAGAAAEAGIKKGDAIIKIDDAVVSSSSQLAEQVARHKPGDKINVTVLRGKEQKVFAVTLKNNLGTFDSQKAALVESLGAKLADVRKEDAKKMNIAGGVQVTEISDGIIGNETNMKPGFVITKVAGVAVKSTDELKDALTRAGNNFQIEGMYPGNNEVYYYGINDFKR
jgi:Do/DeqQ family serine protease